MKNRLKAELTPAHEASVQQFVEAHTDKFQKLFKEVQLEGMEEGEWNPRIATDYLFPEVSSWWVKAIGGPEDDEDFEDTEENTNENVENREDLAELRRG